ncbi:MAG TPA: tetratricopeptide repeat protein [Candidatus Cybelea sp.]|nr:tetratricopeptide repeat protein [Candidatus Cybelea sp.]
MARDSLDRTKHKAQKQLLAAVERHRAGRLDEAETLYKRALQQDPRSVDALHLLGVIALDRGRIAEAVKLISRAVELNPAFAGLRSNLGNALRRAGRVDEAVAQYQRAVELQPRNAEFLSNLAAGLLDQERFAEAAEWCRQAIALQPGMAEAHANLGLALQGSGELSEAERSLRKAIEANPKLTFAHRGLGKLLRDSSRSSEAVACFRRVCELEPASAEAWFALASALSAAGDLAGAIAALDDAARLEPASGRIWVALGNAFRKQGTIDKAVACFRRALEIEGADATAGPDGSDSSAIWNILGCAERDRGKFDEAANCFRKALELWPDNADAYENLVMSERKTAAAADMARLTELLAKSDLPDNQRAAAAFALGKSYDDQGAFDAAFANYAEGNAIILRTVSDADRFDPAQFHEGIGQIVATFTPEFFAERSGWGMASERPVFIVGMPRSGTTLVEQIAASHSQVFGAGEVADVTEVMEVLTGLSGPAQVNAAYGADRWTPESIRRMAETMDGRLKSLAPKALRVTDKMLDNLFMLGLVAVMFPNARVVFCRRDPRDTCLSCFFQRFETGNFFAYDLRACGFRHFEVDRLIDHWHRALPLKMLDVQYETLVAALEPESRRLIEFLGLPWEEQCLEFHRTERVVSTASFWQVRQPLYDRSVGRWRNYERHLGPLLEGLSGRLESGNRSE